MAERVSRLYLAWSVTRGNLGSLQTTAEKKETCNIAFKTSPHEVISSVCLRRNKTINPVIHSLIDKNVMVIKPYN